MARASGQQDEILRTGVLSVEAAAEGEPFRPAAGVVLRRSGAEEEVQLRIPEVAGAHQQ
jgi:hypothetical protein